MAHNLAVDSQGKVAYYGRQSAWHILGTVKGTYFTTEELFREENFCYDLFKSQLRDGLGRPVDAYGVFRWNHADKKMGNKEAAIFLSAVGADYTVIHHSHGMRGLDALMRTKDGAHIETAGVLGKGEKVWVLADLGLACKVGNEQQKGYLLFSTAHDGSMSFSFRIVWIRVVCQNTLSAALSAKARACLTIRHTKHAESRIEDAHAALAAIGDDCRSMEDKLNFLAGRKLTREALDVVLNRLFPKKEESKIQTRRENILSDVLKIYESNDGNAYPEQRGTAYNLLNAVTNYTDHERSSKADGRALSAAFGSGDSLKNDALSILLDVSRDLAVVRTPQASIQVDFAELGLNVPGVRN